MQGGWFTALRVVLQNMNISSTSLCAALFLVHRPDVMGNVSWPANKPSQRCLQGCHGNSNRGLVDKDITIKDSYCVSPMKIFGVFFFIMRHLKYSRRKALAASAQLWLLILLRRLCEAFCSTIPPLNMHHFSLNESVMRIILASRTADTWQKMLYQAGVWK